MIAVNPRLTSVGIFGVRLGAIFPPCGLEARVKPASPLNVEDGALRLNPSQLLLILSLQFFGLKFKHITKVCRL